MTRAPRTFDHDEPHFLLETADLRLPPGPGQIVPLGDAPEKVIKSWMLGYQLATLGTPPDRVSVRVKNSYANYIKNRSHVVLMEQDTPLTTTGFNAQIPGMVRVGGVHTPPALRGRGHARRAVAHHIGASGVQRATLFAASDVAALAYQSIGFQRIGNWTVVLLAGKERLG